MSAKGEMYKSKGAMKKHEKGESKKEKMMEYGKPMKKGTKVKPESKFVAPKKKVPMKGSKY